MHRRHLVISPKEIVDRQLTAYNNRDIDASVACYRTDAKVVQPDRGILASGHEEIRERYGQLFNLDPTIRAEIPNRIVVGTMVIDEERITGFNLPGFPSEMHAAVAYRIEGDVIESAQLLV